MFRIGDKVFCSKCRAKTNHSVLQNSDVDLVYVQQHSDKNICNHYIVRCDGCDSISFLRESKYTNEADVVKMYYRVYPDPMERMDELDLPSFNNLPDSIFIIITEVHVAYIQQMYLLCAIGLRITIEAICNDKMIQGKNLDNKIDALRGSGVISESQLKVLQQIRIIGNNTAHHITSYDQELLREGIKIIDSILYSIYEIDKISLKLGKA